jgi:hypothetical protein
VNISSAALARDDNKTGHGVYSTASEPRSYPDMSRFLGTIASVTLASLFSVAGSPKSSRARTLDNRVLYCIHGRGKEREQSKVQSLIVIPCTAKQIDDMRTKHPALTV